MNRFDFNQGYEHAKEMIMEACQYPDVFYKESGLTTVIANLESAIESQPKDYADGVRYLLRQVTQFLATKPVR